MFDHTSTRLALGIGAVRRGTMAALQALGLHVDAKAIADSAVEEFASVHTIAAEVEREHRRDGTTPTRAPYDTIDTYTRSLVTALTAIVDGDRQGMERFEAVTFASRAIAHLTVDALPADAIALKSAAIFAAGFIVTASSVAAVDAALNPVPSPAPPPPAPAPTPPVSARPPSIRPKSRSDGPVT